MAPLAHCLMTRCKLFAATLYSTGPQEHCLFVKLNPGVENCPALFAQRAGSTLTSIQSGICGASFRPLVSVGAFDWVFKVQFKGVEDLEVYYGLLEDLVEGANAEDLISASLIVDLPGLRGSIKAGVGELLALFKVPPGADASDISDDVDELAPVGMTTTCIRRIHESESLFSGYESMQPGYTHALLVNFSTAEELAAFNAGGALQGFYSRVVPADSDPATQVFSYVF